MNHFLRLVVILSIAQKLSAAIVYIQLPEPFDANARHSEGELGYSSLPIDLDGDGEAEFIVVVIPEYVGILHVTDSRVFIATSPPPNIGGSVASILGGVEINGNIGDMNFRWYNGQPGSNGFPVVLQTRVTDLGVVLDSGSAGHTRGRDGYVGFEFKLADGVHYGWMHLDASAVPKDSQGSFIGTGGFIDGWAWETTPGLGIVAGAVPEPSISLLTTFVIGGLLLRRQRVAIV